MSIQFISELFHIARKDYWCQSSEYLREYLDNNPTGTKIRFSEWRNIIKAKNNNWKILKGEKYRRYVGIYDGEIFSARDIPEIAKICQRLHLYTED